MGRWLEMGDGWVRAAEENRTGFATDEECPKCSRSPARHPRARDGRPVSRLSRPGRRCLMCTVACVRSPAELLFAHTQRLVKRIKRY